MVSDVERRREAQPGGTLGQVAARAGVVGPRHGDGDPGLRHLAGSEAEVAEVGTTGLEQWRKKAPSWLTQLRDVTAERWSKTGDVASLLEPDLKDGHGGLRDYDSIRWALATDRSEISASLEAPIEDLAAPAETLLATRCELHRVTGKSTNVLLLQDQDAVADAMGFADADVLMARVSEAARAIEWASERFWWRRAGRAQEQGTGDDAAGRRSAAAGHHRRRRRGRDRCRRRRRRPVVGPARRRRCGARSIPDQPPRAGDVVGHHHRRRRSVERTNATCDGQPARRRIPSRRFRGSPRAIRAVQPDGARVAPRSQPSATQRLSHLHRRSASPADGRQCR